MVSYKKKRVYLRNFQETLIAKIGRLLRNFEGSMLRYFLINEKECTSPLAQCIPEGGALNMLRYGVVPPSQGMFFKNMFFQGIVFSKIMPLCSLRV